MKTYTRKQLKLSGRLISLALSTGFLLACATTQDSKQSVNVNVTIPTPVPASSQAASSTPLPLVTSPPQTPANNPTAQPTTLPTVQPTVQPMIQPTPGPVTDSEFTDDTVFKQRWDIVDAPDTAEGPSRWLAENGKIIQKSNIFRHDLASLYFEGTNAIRKSAPLRNFVYSADLLPTDNDGYGMLFRYQDENNYYRMISVQDPANDGPFTRLQIKRNGVFKTLAGDNKAVSNVPGADSVRIEVNGSDIQFYVNGALRFRVSNDELSSGRVGLMTYACSLEVSKFKLVELP